MLAGITDQKTMRVHSAEDLNMRQKLTPYLLLWLLLFALVFVYTDRDEYSAALSGDALSSVFQSEEETARREADYAAMMARERKAAEERTAKGLWGAEVTENEYADTLPFSDPEGFNLMWGDYEAVLTYDTGTAFSVRAVSCGRQRFLRGEPTEMPAGKKQSASFRFSLTDSAEHVRFSADLPEGTRLRTLTVRRITHIPFSADLMVYAVLLGLVLSFLLHLSHDATPRGAARRRDAFILVCAALFASMPLLWDGLQEGHDLLFHLNRIEGIASVLRAGQFPARIHASTLQGYGYAAGVFYPDLFLYFPALLRNLGVSLADSLRVFLMAINLLVAFSCYACVHRLTGERKTALGASILYTLSIYRLVNLYVRATYGESLAMLFFPPLILAMAEVLERDEKKWPLLCAAMTGIALNHLISTLFAVFFCSLAALLSLPRLLREPRRILSILLAAALTVLCTLCFFVPMLSYLKEGVSTSVVLDASQHVLKLGSYLVILSGNNGTIAPEREDFAYTIGVVPGLALLLGCALLLLQVYRNDGKASDSVQTDGKLCRRLLLLGALALLGATEFFPWARAVSLPRPFSTFFMQLQFPWRLVSIAVPLLVIVSAKGYLSHPRYEPVGLAMLFVLSVVTAGYTMQCFVQDEPILTRTGYVDTRVGQFEYTYFATEKTALAPGEILVTKGEEAVVTDYEKHGNDLRFGILLPTGAAHVELPVLYYPGYRAEIEGKGTIRVTRGTNNRARLTEIPGGEAVRVHVWFSEPVSWRISEGASLLGFLLLFFLLARTRRGEAR